MIADWLKYNPERIELITKIPEIKYRNNEGEEIIKEITEADTLAVKIWVSKLSQLIHNSNNSNSQHLHKSCHAPRTVPSVEILLLCSPRSYEVGTGIVLIFQPTDTQRSWINCPKLWS